MQPAKKGVSGAWEGGAGRVTFEDPFAVAAVASGDGVWQVAGGRWLVVAGGWWWQVAGGRWPVVAGAGQWRVWR